MLAHIPIRLEARSTPTRAAELLIGCLFTIVVDGPKGFGASSPRRTQITSLGGLAALLTLLEINFHEPASNELALLLVSPAVALLCCIVVVALVDDASPLRPLLAARPLVQIGKRSYGVYLWHFPIFVLIDNHLGLTSWPPRLLGLALTAVVTALSYKYVEEPFLLGTRRLHLPRIALIPAGAVSLCRRSTRLVLRSGETAS